MGFGKYQRERKGCVEERKGCVGKQENEGSAVFLEPCQWPALNLSSLCQSKKKDIMKREAKEVKLLQSL